MQYGTHRQQQQLLPIIEYIYIICIIHYIIHIHNMYCQQQVIVLPQPLLVGESPMLNENNVEFSKAIWKDTDRAQFGGVICSTPCSAQRPAFDIGFEVHNTLGVFPGRTDILPVVRSTQYA